MNTSFQKKSLSFPYYCWIQSCLFVHFWKKCVFDIFRLFRSLELTCIFLSAYMGCLKYERRNISSSMIKEKEGRYLCTPIASEGAQATSIVSSFYVLLILSQSDSEWRWTVKGMWGIVTSCTSTIPWRHEGMKAHLLFFFLQFFLLTCERWKVIF